MVEGRNETSKCEGISCALFFQRILGDSFCYSSRALISCFENQGLGCSVSSTSHYLF